ncbi:LysR substrate-binding domain-containing protein [Acerihabitans sp. TG2]|nr:LysR substrate-binding domain-containing protein [Acerihabitans sp. TG2]MEA9389760.1 LysR substrate-binding domain-containing protein [Acerihabitans sp. TG2]
MVANHVQDLERRLGTKLIQRTTRRQSLTEVGQTFLADCLDVLARVETAEDAARERHSRPSGHLRVSATVSFGTSVVTPLIHDYLRLYPDVEVDLRLTDRVVDLTEEGIEAAFRFGDLPDSGLIARPLRPCFRVVCASPDYLAKHGVPLTPADLAQHNCLLFRDGAPRNHWQFSGLLPVQVSGRFVVDNGTALLSAVRDGLGVALLADFEIADDIATGRLVRLLRDTATPAWPLALVHLADRRMTAKLSRFVELALQRLG